MKLFTPISDKLYTTAKEIDTSKYTILYSEFMNNRYN